MTENSNTKSEDGSIETVLSSIRRILQEGKENKAASETRAEAPVFTPPQVGEDEDEDSVLVLDSSMMADGDEDEPHEDGSQHRAEPEHEAHAAEHPAPEEPAPVMTHAEEPAHEPPAPVAETPAPHHEPEHAHVEEVAHAEPVAAQPEEPAHDAPSAAPEEATPQLAAPAPEPAPAPPETHALALQAPETGAEEHAGAVENVPPPIQELAHSTGTPAKKEQLFPLTRPGVTMSEDRDTSETQNYPAGYTGGGATSDSDAPDPVQIPLDKQTIGATEHSFGALQQMLRRKQSVEHRERKVAITRGGNLTIEDIVRDEVRAFLKEWLDQHLSGIVQQAVQKEIERLSDR
ncbi:DUF2497 domain-containing protein [Acetobacter oeni]|uniref:DUF2497 domain-containing protein n=1 Tax=Acetobacter oeni TaxID=304077 RepID=A0A511XIN9_9PROT|nr:DUF2497 domain-containing protein [Acetobacter oeni]MBB3881925.1 cell pole-organizing protein PopZ [Acetobacter oeni]GBR02404.1 hypothetical protein AA21952_0731 [Acetobacter oeni LMG 21952]GEN62818.1 hypothetical protein AOE01nite_10420 [Acetobacter oeni]